MVPLLRLSVVLLLVFYLSRQSYIQLQTVITSSASRLLSH